MKTVVCPAGAGIPHLARRLPRLGMVGSVLGRVGRRGGVATEGLLNRCCRKGEGGIALGRNRRDPTCMPWAGSHAAAYRGAACRPGGGAAAPRASPSALLGRILGLPLGMLRLGRDIIDAPDRCGALLQVLDLLLYIWVTGASATDQVEIASRVRACIRQPVPAPRPSPPVLTAQGDFVPSLDTKGPPPGRADSHDNVGLMYPIFRSRAGGSRGGRTCAWSTAR
jgi:hypothetical protein